MIFRAALMALTLFVPLTTTGWAAPAAQGVQTDTARALFEALRGPEVIVQMRDEGLIYADELMQDMAPGLGGASWRRVARRIYNAEHMEEVVFAAFARRFGAADAAPLLRFLATSEGQRLVTLELSARAAMHEPDIEAAARAHFRAQEAAEAADYLRVQAYVEANDLVEANVAGTLNATYAYFRGLADGGALDLTEREMLEQISAREHEVRADTREWVYGLLMMAYAPLDPEVLERYTVLARSPEGQALTAGLFAGFDDMYNEISYALGRAIADRMQGSDL